MSLDKIKIFDSIVSVEYQNFIRDQLFARDVPWVFLPDVTAHADTGNLGFAHLAFEHATIKSTCYWFLYPVFLECCSKGGITNAVLDRIRVGLYVNVNSDKPHTKHIDMEQPHFVGLYYVDDADGDTVFYVSKDSDVELMRYKPKKGSMVVFDGSIYHASTSPTNCSHRVAINYTFFVTNNKAAT